MREIEANYDNIKRICWAMFWRFSLLSILAGGLAGFVIGLIFGMIAGLTGSSWLLGIIPPIGAIAGFVAAFFVFAYVLISRIGKSDGKHRLVLVEDAQA